MIFENIEHIIWLIIILPIIIWVYIKRPQRGKIYFSSINDLKQIKPSLAHRFRHILFVLRILALVLFVIALMRPRLGLEEARIETEGIDIVLAIDISGSMQAEDFVSNGERINRLEAVKNVVREFIQKRRHDRIGLVVFAGAAYIQCPLTLDYDVLLSFLDRIHVGMIEDGTAMGDGIAASLTRLRKLETKSKIMILLTDGVNNAGNVEPLTAAELSKTLNVRIYTIGAGSKGRVPFPAKDFFGNKIYQWAVIDLDETLLQEIAEISNGRYFRATDTKELSAIYEEINQMERTKIELDAYTDYRELFTPFLLLGLALLILEFILRQTRYRTLP